MVYGSGLENQRVFTGTVGSNPTLSVFQQSPQLQSPVVVDGIFCCAERNLEKRYKEYGYIDHVATLIQLGEW